MAQGMINVEQAQNAARKVKDTKPQNVPPIETQSVETQSEVPAENKSENKVVEHVKRFCVLALPNTAQRRPQVRDNGTADYFLAIGQVEIIAGSGIMAPCQVKRHKLADGTVEERATLKATAVAPSVWRQYLTAEGATGEKNLNECRLEVMAAYDAMIAKQGPVVAETSKRADPTARIIDPATF